MRKCWGAVCSAVLWLSSPSAVGAEANALPPPPLAVAITKGLAGTVLLVTTLPGGMASYGSGVVIDRTGLVLTNLHVLDGALAVHALAYDEHKPTVPAIEGGLDRLVFERQADLIPVRLVRGDPVVDLAVVQLEAPAVVHVLSMRQQPAAVGMPVLAIGHPEQNFWSVTRGIISSQHDGMLQHDAALNKGNSGGPLLDESGELIGINTLMQKGTQGLFFARPIALASRIVDVVKVPLVMDRSTPEKAILACARARELADPGFSQCVHWGSHYDFFRLMVEMFFDVSKSDGFGVRNAVFANAPSLRGGPKSRPRKVIREWLDKGDGRASTWVQRYGPMAVQWVTSDDPKAFGQTMDQFLMYIGDGTRGGRPPEQRARAASRDMPPAALKQRLIEQSKHVHDDILLQLGLDASDEWLPRQELDALTFRSALKMGVRVEKVQQRPDGYAWVQVAGRKTDGTVYRYSTLLKREPDGYRESQPPMTAQSGLSKPPAGFAPAFDTLTVPLMFGAALAAMQLVVASVRDPVGGSNVDFDLEHHWPLVLDVFHQAAAGDPHAAERVIMAAVVLHGHALGAAGQ